MHRHPRRPAAFAITLALASASIISLPTQASCIALADLLPEPTAAGPSVFSGTVLAVDEISTELAVEAWYVGGSPVERLVVVGGRDPGAITSVEWTPPPGGHYIVVAEPGADGTWITGTCQQSEPYPDLLAALEARYGEPQLPPFPEVPGSPATASPTGSGSPQPVITSNDSPLPDSLVHGTPEP
jgi:hypothetical protein